MHERVTWQELLKWCVTTPLLDTDNRTFGDVPLRVYEGPRFFIEALVWNDGQLAIHDHAFAGAFTMRGSRSVTTCSRSASRRAPTRRRRGPIASTCRSSSSSRIVRATDLVGHLQAAWEAEPGHAVADVLNAITRAAHATQWRTAWTTESLEQLAGEMLTSRIQALPALTPKQLVAFAA